MPYELNEVEYLNSAEAANLLNMNLSTFRWHVHKGNVTVATRIGRTPLFTKPDLEQFARDYGNGRDQSGANRPHQQLGTQVITPI